MGDSTAGYIRYLPKVALACGDVELVPAAVVGVGGARPGHAERAAELHHD